MGTKAPKPSVEDFTSKVPAPPSLSQTINDYITNLPKMISAEKEYGPQYAQLEFDLEKQFGPQYSDYLAGEQKRLTPYTYGLQEELAKMAS